MKSRRQGIIDYWFSNRCTTTPFSTSTVVEPDSDATGWAPFDLPPRAESLHFSWSAQRGPDRRLSLTRLLDRGAEDGPQPQGISADEWQPGSVSPLPSLSSFMCLQANAGEMSR
jgi:hypothetical protein